MWRANFKKILNKDVQGLCNLSCHTSLHSFVVDLQKKETRNVLLKFAVARPQLDVSICYIYH